MGEVVDGRFEIESRTLYVDCAIKGIKSEKLFMLVVYLCLL